MPDFEELYREYYMDVYKYVLSLCRSESQAEEITQEAFFKAFRNIDRFKGECKVYVWLCQIAKNTFLSDYKMQKHFTAADDYTEQPSKSNIENEYLSGEAVYEMQKAIHGMDEPYKEVLMLRIFGELSFACIAELFSKTESWARVTYHRAKNTLKERLP